MEQYQRNWKNYYEILQVSRNAEPEVITAAYRRLAQKYHPDATSERFAAAKMVELNEAYEILSNASKRAEYDVEFGIRASAQRSTRSHAARVRTSYATTSAQRTTTRRKYASATGQHRATAGGQRSSPGAAGQEAKQQNAANADGSGKRGPAEQRLRGLVHARNGMFFVLGGTIALAVDVVVFEENTPLDWLGALSLAVGLAYVITGLVTSFKR